MTRSVILSGAKNLEIATLLSVARNDKKGVMTQPLTVCGYRKPKNNVREVVIMYDE